MQLIDQVIIESNAGDFTFQNPSIIFNHIEHIIFFSTIMGFLTSNKGRLGEYKIVFIKHDEREVFETWDEADPFNLKS